MSYNQISGAYHKKERVNGMDKRTETLEQLRHAEQLLYQKVYAVSALSSTETQIKRLQSESEKGVPYQLWYPTDHAEKETKRIEGELENTKKERLKKYTAWFVLSIICPVTVGLLMCIIGFVLTCTGEYSGWFYVGLFLYFMGMLIMGLTYPLCTRNVVNARRRAAKEAMEWTQDQIARKRHAEEMDAQNTQLNLKKKAELDAALFEKNSTRITKLQPLLKEQQLTYDRCCAEVDKLDILGRKDRNLYTVGQLIHIIESNRADNITSALLVYDEQQARKEAQRAQEEAVATTRKMAQQMVEAEELRREEQLLRDQAEREHRRRMEELAYMQLSEMEKQRGEMEQQRKQVERDAAADAAHRRRMEELAKEQTEELERKRKADYDYRKYGRIDDF